MQHVIVKKRKEKKKAKKKKQMNKFLCALLAVLVFATVARK